MAYPGTLYQIEKCNLLPSSGNLFAYHIQSHRQMECTNFNVFHPFHGMTVHHCNSLQSLPLTTRSIQLQTKLCSEPIMASILPSCWRLFQKQHWSAVQGELAFLQINFQLHKEVMEKAQEGTKKYFDKWIKCNIVLKIGDKFWYPRPIRSLHAHHRKVGPGYIGASEVKRGN